MTIGRTQTGYRSSSGQVALFYEEAGILHYTYTELLHARGF
jgi:hypothetical protein